MTRTTTMTVRLSETLSAFVSTNVGEHGSYVNVGEYVRDLIRRDNERNEQAQFVRLQAELGKAFAAPESFLSVRDSDYGDRPEKEGGLIWWSLSKRQRRIGRAKATKVLPRMPAEFSLGFEPTVDAPFIATNMGKLSS